MLLYIHIPFCDSKCHYCAFNSYTSLHHLRDNFTDALCEQLTFELSKIDKDIIETVFIGGGTPSCLSIEQYKKIFNTINPYLINTKEITSEANPNSATTKWLQGMYDLGVNRISFGVQSFNDKKLEFLNRNHTSTMAFDSIVNAKAIGFEHINCDIIYDTTLDTKELLYNDIETIKKLPIDHISAYSLTLEEGTKFYNKSNVQVENIKLANYLFDSLTTQGFTQYEISNFALNNDAKSKHNLGYWNYTQYIGCGAGAVGCINNQRLYTHKDIQKYINSPTSYASTEDLTLEDIKTEKILLGLRCEVGISKDILNDKELKQIDYLEQTNKIIFKDNTYYSTDFMLADELALYILD